ncbi:MAG: hypothetical protein AAGG51_14365 [Cyanobacteria bacterium P01_G01_bin.54]
MAKPWLVMFVVESLSDGMVVPCGNQRGYSTLLARGQMICYSGQQPNIEIGRRLTEDLITKERDSVAIPTPWVVCAVQSNALGESGPWAGITIATVEYDALSNGEILDWIEVEPIAGPDFSVEKEAAIV